MKKPFKSLGLAAALLLMSTTPAFAAETTGVDDVVIFDQDGINFTVKSEERSEWDEYLLNVEIENNTENDILVSWDNTCVNGWVCTPFFGVEITAGNKAIEKVCWYETTLEEVGIEEVEEIFGKLIISDSQSWDIIAESEFTLYPKGEVISEFPVRELADTDYVLLDNDDYTISAVSFNEKNEWDESLLCLYFNNKSDKNLTVATDAVSVNGIMCDPFWGMSIPKGKQAYCNIAWFTAQLEEMSIESFENIDMGFLICDSDSYDLIQEEKFDINISDLYVIAE